MLYLLLLLVPVIQCSFELNDDILYGINWFEKPIENNQSRSVTIKTALQEKYNCLIPNLYKPKHSDYSVDNYDGPTEYELIRKLFEDKICSNKESPYWFYEVCHGKHVRQYHEALETSGKEIFKRFEPATVQQYFLGYYQTTSEPKHSSNPSEKKKIPQMTINSVKLPYYTVNMSGGDYCDLINRPRSVEIFYFCHESVQANLYDFQEIRSCEYQAIIFTRYLCEHPAYKMKDNFINDISCYPLEGSPAIPSSLSKIQSEIKSSENIISSVDTIIDNSKMESQIKVEAYRKNGIIYYRIITLDKAESNENTNHVDSKQSEAETKEPSSKLSENQESQSQQNYPTKPAFSEPNNLMSKYLSTKYCIESGASYWRHRVCFLKKISQYHMEVDLETQEIIMGFWNEEKHLQWLEQYPIMKPKLPVEERMDIYHQYTDGSYCDEIKANRRSILKISCINDNSSSVTVTVSEPTMCNYVVVVKGSVFCPLVKEADENGLIKHN